MNQSLQNRISKFADWIGNHHTLTSISTAFMMLLPVFIVGSLFTLLVGLNIDAYQQFIQNHGIKTALELGPQFTTSVISIYLVCVMAFVTSNKSQTANHRFVIVLISLMSFLIVTPLVNSVSGDTTKKLIDFEWLGSQGMFTALLIPIMVTQIFELFLKKNWILRLPSAVPPAIQNSFIALAPSIATISLFIGINALFALTPFENFHALAYGLLLLPLQNISTNFWTMLLIICLMHFLWFFGLHGTMLLGPIILLMLTNATIANTEAYAANLPLPNILTLGFLTLVMVGGIGATFSLSVLMLFAKSQRYKSLSKVSIIPSIFGINEPIVFGFPIVLNPRMGIPFIIAPIVNTVVLYLLMAFNLVSFPSLMNLPTGTPILINGFLQMGTSGVISQVLLILIDLIIFYPFFKYEDQNALLLEAQTHDLSTNS